MPCVGAIQGPGPAAWADGAESAQQVMPTALSVLVNTLFI